MRRRAEAAAAGAAAHLESILVAIEFVRNKVVSCALRGYSGSCIAGPAQWAWKRRGCLDGRLHLLRNQDLLHNRAYRRASGKGLYGKRA